MATLKVTNIKNESFAGDQLYLKSDGRLGIGTTSPSTKLQVSSGHINIDSGYSFQWDDSHERIEQSDGKIEFFTANGEKMTLSGDYLGIGTSSPQSLIHTSSGSSSGGLFLESNGCNAYLWAVQNAGNLINGSTAGRMGLRSANGFDFSGNDGTAVQLNIDSSGQFALGRANQITGNGNSSTSVFEQLSNNNYPLALHSAQTNKRGLMIFYSTTGAGNAGDPFIVCTDNTNNKFIVTSDGNTTIRGNLAIATAGKGIDFSAQTASSATGATVNGELLDHFEEGTWTPSQPTVGWYSGAEIEGKYQRVGHWVTATFIVKFATNGSGVQGLIDGLPFVSGGSGSAGRYGGAVTYTTDSNVFSFLIGNSEARIYIYNSSGTAVQLTHLDDDEVRGTVIYRVA